MNQIFRDGQWVDIDRPVKHGAYSTYSNRGCRCEQCREAHNAWHRQYRTSTSGKTRTVLANRKSRRIQQLTAEYMRTHLPTEFQAIVDKVAKENEEFLAKEQ